MVPYQDYITSPSWALRRKKIWKCGKIQRRRGCQCCLRVGIRLDLHHISYENLGRETYRDVVPLCRECHDQVHGLAKNCTPEELARAFAEVRAYYRAYPIAYTLIHS